MQLHILSCIISTKLLSVLFLNAETLYGSTFCSCPAVPWKIHWRAAKFIPTLWHQPYTDRLVFLKLPSLQYRRWTGDLILMYKITHGLTGIGRSIFIFKIHFPPPEVIYVKFSSVLYTTMLELNFSRRIVIMWNNLPSDIIEATSVNSMLVLNLF